MFFFVVLSLLFEISPPLRKANKAKSSLFLSLFSYSHPIDLALDAKSAFTCAGVSLHAPATLFIADAADDDDGVSPLIPGRFSFTNS